MPSGYVERGLSLAVDVVRTVGRKLHSVYAALGLVLTAGLVLAVLGIWGFAAVAEEVMGGGTQAVDTAILRWINSHAAPGIDRVILDVTSLGDTLVVAVTALVAAGFLRAAGRGSLAILVLVAVAGGGLLNHVLKWGFQRPRPEVFQLETPFARPISASFPSGHSTSAAILFLIIAYAISCLGPPRHIRVLTWALAVVLMLAVGASRVYLGVHYPSDVAAGLLFGFVWTVVCILVMEVHEVLRSRGEVEEVGS